MREYKIRKIIDYENRFQVEIEYLDNGDREKFGFPLGNGFEIQDADGTYRFEEEIATQVTRKCNCKKNMPCFKTMKQKCEGKKVNAIPQLKQNKLNESNAEPQN